MAATPPAATVPAGQDPRTVWSRRRLLAGLLLVPPALAGCSLIPGSGSDEPDPLIALADAARADAALAAAAVAADPELAESLQPLVDARTEHATALDAEVARLDPGRPTPGPPPPPTTPQPGLADVRQAVLASGQAATDVALGLPAARTGLVASVAACCGTYAEVLS
ncbi:hypothetical protein [Pseudonocardia sp. MH-G8]|uniref:hypothetical protein n=1 Tax=Pseudonocardia sp. MH-G8 TaxID=1854588 RepID=UPI00117AB399|nr:hypothetical protein [Pseudonocardia sp. MH-G8]